MPKYSPDEIIEIIKCHKDEIHFIRTYFKTLNPFNGLSLIELEPKQINVLNKIKGKQLVIESIFERQIGTSTILAAHVLWLALFHPDQRIVIMNVKNANAAEMRKLIKDGLNNMPEFLKPKVITDHVYSLEFDNGSWMHYVNSNPVHLRGFNTSCLIFDHFDSYKEDYRNELRRYNKWRELDTVELLKV